VISSEQLRGPKTRKEALILITGGRPRCHLGIASRPSTARLAERLSQASSCRQDELPVMFFVSNRGRPTSTVS
jgi:hypothetical protein